MIRPARVQGEGAAAEVATRSRNRPSARRGRRHRRPRRRMIEDLWASTRSASRARSSRARCRSCRPSDTRRLDDCRLRRRPARPDALGGRRNGRCGDGGVLRRIDRLTRGCARRHAPMLNGAGHGCTSSPAAADSRFGPSRHARPARRGGDAPAARRDGQQADSPPTPVPRASGSPEARISAAGWRRSVGGWKPPHAPSSGITRRRERAQARLAASVGRLESLTPLGVLGRGYAGCWNEMVHGHRARRRQRQRRRPRAGDARRGRAAVWSSLDARRPRSTGVTVSTGNEKPFQQVRDINTAIKDFESAVPSSTRF